MQRQSKESKSVTDSPVTTLGHIEKICQVLCNPPTHVWRSVGFLHMRSSGSMVSSIALYISVGEGTRILKNGKVLCVCVDCTVFTADGPLMRIYRIGGGRIQGSGGPCHQREN